MGKELLLGEEKANKSEIFFTHSAFKQCPTSLFRLPEVATLKQGDRRIYRSEGYFILLWVMGGEHIIGDEKQTLQTNSGNHIYLVPMGGFLSLESTTSGLTCLSMRFHPSTHLCLGECPDQTSQDGGKKRKHSCRNKLNQPCVMRSMPMSSGVELWGKTVGLYLKFPHIDVNVFDIKLQEFFLLLRLDYTRQMAEEFLRFYHCKNTGFRTKVFHLGYSNATIDELGQHFKLSPTTLKRMFVEEFGLSPQKWMMQQKCRYIYNDILQQELTLQDIVKRYGFSSISYLCQFCRKNFGYTPQQIRKSNRLPAYEQH